MPGYKVVLQDGGEIREGLACFYCKLVLKNPVQTSESGLRLCRECYDNASKNPLHVEMNRNNQIWPDFAVKKDIDNLKVKCDNCTVGCDWNGLFKQLMQHSQECQYVAVECRNPGCGQQVLKTKMEVHLKEECNQRRVNCENCNMEMFFIELKDHGPNCPNAPKACKNCKKKMPASKLADHMIYECKSVRCVCKSDKTYEAGSGKFHSHLQDTGKLADHLGPMICEFTKMSGVFKEMTTAYQQAVKRIDTLEKGHQENAHRIEMLESAHEEDAKRIETLEKNNDKLEESVKQAEKKAQSVKVDLKNKVELLEKQNGDLSRAIEQNLSSMALVSKGPSFNKTDFQHFEQKINQKVGFLEKRWTNLNNEIKDICKNNSQLSNEIDNLKHQYTVSIPSSKMSAFGGGEILPYEKPSSEVRQLEEKVLELERTLNVISVHHSELELQLQASLASTNNGAFLWRIPEVHRRIRDARLGSTSLYSPPFYTGRNGYKMCMMVYFNGYGTGLSTHLSVFFVLMKGEDDPLLQWPFKSKVSLILVDQDHKNNLVQTIQPNIQSSFQRPVFVVTDDCQEFASLSILDDPSYVKDDVMYIKAIVDTSNILHP